MRFRACLCQSPGGGYFHATNAVSCAHSVVVSTKNALRASHHSFMRTLPCARRAGRPTVADRSPPATPPSAVCTTLCTIHTYYGFTNLALNIGFVFLDAVKKKNRYFVLVMLVLSVSGHSFMFWFQLYIGPVTEFCSIKRWKK